MEYQDLLESIENKLMELDSDYEIKIPDDSWVNEAKIYATRIIEAIEAKVKPEEYFKKEELLYEKTVTSLSDLYELNRILSLIKNVGEENIEIFKKKLKTVFKAPLLLMDETGNTNEGRNIMFELRLFTRLIQKGYNAKLLEHPDILVQVDENEYAIECKRIFKSETLIANAKAAIDQLNTYSLKNKQRYGIVAISITRYLHDGKLRFVAKSEQSAKLKLNTEMTNILETHKDELLSLFPIKIPALFFEYFDRAEIGKPYTITLIDIIETANGRPSLFHKVKKDFENLS